MAVFRDDPYGNHCFTVDLGNGEHLRGAIEVILPDLCIALNNARPGDAPLPIAPQTAAKPVYTNCVIKRAYQGSLEMYQWWQLAASGAPRAQTHRTVVISLLNETRQQVSAWILHNAIPARYFFSPLSSRDGAVLVESLEIAAESVSME